jgi:hypothetical protein
MSPAHAHATPHLPHSEKHFEAPESVRDVVIGMSDGLTVPFALAAGLSGTVSATWIVVVAGLAEIAAGSIAMGLGGYLAARTDRDHYVSEREREHRETIELPEKEIEEVAEVFRGYGMSEAEIRPVVTAISSDRERWVDFMKARPQQRRHHCGFLCRRRTGAAGAVYADRATGSGAAGFRGGHAGGAVRVRLGERQAHRHLPLAGRLANHHHRRLSLRCGVRPG